jgi:DNA polymerase-3 subunit epsilon
MNGILFFDTETTGFADFKLPEIHPAQPHLVQLAAILGNNNGDVVNSFNVIIAREPTFNIPHEATKVHGITASDCFAYGIPLFTALRMFNALAMQAHTVVAHNLDFDVRIVRSEVARLNYQLEKAGKEQGRDALDPKAKRPLKRFCTMQESKDILRLQRLGGGAGYKFPSLQELHQYYFGKQFDKAHDALADTRACMLAYYQMMKPSKLELTVGEEMDARAKAAQQHPFVQWIEEKLGAKFTSNEENERRKKSATKAQSNNTDHEWI